MIYQTASDWTNEPRKRVLLFGMSGLGKTHVSNMLRDSGKWFHYSVDYRIGTRYMGEFILDNIKREAMKNPFLRALLMSDSIHIGSNITFDNLTPLSSYLGKPGQRELGGLDFATYQTRQAQHHRAEVSALLDSVPFIERAQELYGYGNFVCDSGGSICEVVDPSDPDDPVLSALSENLLLVWIKGNDAHNSDLIRRFDAAPKPMCYQAEFLQTVWGDFLRSHGVASDQVDPDAFVRWAYARALKHRQPLYTAMAKNWGVTVSASDVAAATDPQSFNQMIARALENKH